MENQFSSPVVSNKLINDNRPAGQKRKVEPERVQVTDTVEPPKADSYPECLFCKKKHAGGAQECAFLEQHIQDHPDEISESLTKKVTYPSDYILYNYYLRDKKDN